MRSQGAYWRGVMFEILELFLGRPWKNTAQIDAYETLSVQRLTADCLLYGIPQRVVSRAIRRRPPTCALRAFDDASEVPYESAMF